MQKLLFILALLIINSNLFAQNNPRPSRSRFWNAKESTFNVKAGDVLVYNVDNNGENYDYIVTINKYDEEINFVYNIPTKNAKGSVSLAAAALKEGAKYEADFTGTNNTMLWLSKNNFRELATDKQTMMDMGNGLDTFMNTNTSTLKINYKGREKIITIYNIENNSDTAKRKITVLNDPNNPLVITLDAGWIATLKEVR